MENFAEQYFLQRKGNCAQAVVAAWHHVSPGTDLSIHEFSSLGQGKAPEGMCGAVYAACRIVGENESSSIVSGFTEKTAGMISCRDIRSLRSIKCVQCVKIAASLLQKHTMTNTIGE